MLHELLQIGEKPFGTIKETALNIIQEEYLTSNGKQVPIKEPEIKDFFPVTPLSLSDSQEDVVRKIEENDFLAVYGPPGTGKTQTILNIIANILMQGKTVQIVSNNNSATENVYERLSSPKYNLGFVAVNTGKI